MHDHMRTTNAHNSLSAHSDQPDCCLLLNNNTMLPFENCFWSVLVLTGPDQIGVKGFV